MSKLEITRVGRWIGSILKYDVIVNNICVGRIGNGESSIFSIEPGDNEIFLKSFGFHSNKLQVAIASGDVAKIKCITKIGISGAGTPWIEHQMNVKNDINSLPDKGDEMHCTNCGNEVGEKAIACPKCGLPPRSENKFCYSCGVEVNEKQIMCVKCGVELQKKGVANSKSWKRKTTAGLLAILLGGLGIHKFYHGSWGWGLIYCLFVWTFIPAIVGGIEGVIYLLMDEDIYEDRYKNKHPFKW
ncbi:MAG: NINE protein [Thermodesulfobacteriota bacterium]